MVFSSLARPKRMQYLGSDGVVYKILAKSGDDLRKDMYAQEMCQSISDAGMKIKTYFIVVLNLAVSKKDEEKHAGLIEWVENVSTFKSCLNNCYQATGTEWNNRTDFRKGEFNFEFAPGFMNNGGFHQYEAIQNMKYAKLEGIRENNGYGAFMDKKEKPTGCQPKWYDLEKVNVMLKRFKKMLKWYRPVLGIHFRQIWQEPRVWYQNRRRFSESLGTMSIVGYVLGLGDRHLENLMINESNGEILHVDFNSLFYHGSMLPVPEIVPFRLTQNLVNGFGVLREAGTFRSQCIRTQEWIRSHESVIFSVMNCMIYDPIADFLIKHGLGETKLFDSDKTGQDRSGKFHSKPQENIFKSVGRKVRGNVGKFGESSKTLMSVDGQVDMVISEATNPGNLCRMFVGWSPWI